MGLKEEISVSAPLFLSMRMVTLVSQDRCDAGGPHNDKDFMDDLQNLKWEHSKQFIYYTVRAQRFVVAKSLDTFCNSTVIKAVTGG